MINPYEKYYAEKRGVTTCTYYKWVGRGIDAQSIGFQRREVHVAEEKILESAMPEFDHFQQIDIAIGGIGIGRGVSIPDDAAGAGQRIESSIGNGHDAGGIADCADLFRRAIERGR